MREAKIGFVLITHRNPAQIKRLINKLNDMFTFQPIACHHDLYKSEMSTTGFPSTVKFVRDFLRTGWGEFSVVLATLAAMRLLFWSEEAPEWFVVLSEADYPIKSSATIVEELVHSPYDAYIQHELIGLGAKDDDWLRLCARRYLRKHLKVPHLTRGLRLSLRSIEVPETLSRPFLPFARNFRCFAGSNWFSANRRCAEYILEWHRQHHALRRHYKNAPNVDESYFQCILCNGQFNLCYDCKRYVDWSARGDHPKTLDIEDLPRMLESSAHFARKFDINRNSLVLDRLDEIVG